MVKGGDNRPRGQGCSPCLLAASPPGSQHPAPHAKRWLLHPQEASTQHHTPNVDCFTPRKPASSTTRQMLAASPQEASIQHHTPNVGCFTPRKPASSTTRQMLAASPPGSQHPAPHAKCWLLHPQEASIQHHTPNVGCFIPRKPASSTTRQVLTWNPQGKRKRGRPRNSWRRDTEAELKQQGTNWSGMAIAAQTRARWRGVVDGLCSTGSDGHK